MKTITQISNQYNIPKSTLRSRAKKHKAFKAENLIDFEGEKLITHESERQPINLIRNPKPLLVLAFKEEYPYLNNEEISQCLSISKGAVDNIIKGDFFIIQSKL